ncbi:Integral membrane protein OS=Streptomyces microflavus OX=1919 GN=Smic_21280 PE=3 SV=1 [Streptomyces microflavus]
MLNRLNGAQLYALGLFRFIIGSDLRHPRRLHPSSASSAAREAEAGAWPGWYAALIQLVCGTSGRLSASAPGSPPSSPSGSMAYAYFKVHQPEALMPVGATARPRPSSAGPVSCWRRPVSGSPSSVFSQAGVLGGRGVSSWLR